MESQDKKQAKSPKRNKETGTKLQRYIKSFLHAVEGISYAVKYEHNMIIIIIMAIFAIALGLILNISNYEWLFVILIIGLIAACEMINTAIEAVIDLISPDINPLAKIAKDSASSATLLLCITALTGGLLIYIPKIIEMFF